VGENIELQDCTRTTARGINLITAGQSICAPQRGERSPFREVPTTGRLPTGIVIAMHRSTHIGFSHCYDQTLTVQADVYSLR
jgi:hypothetical protein